MPHEHEYDPTLQSPSERRSLLSQGVLRLRRLFVQIANIKTLRTHTITTTSNVGIGNSAPAVSLEVGDATGEEIIRASSGVNGDAILSANAFLSTGNPLTQYIVAGGNNWATGVDNADSDKYKISLHITDLGTNNFLAIDTTGDVGIGTSTPQTNLHIESGVPTIRLSDSNAATDQEVAALIEFYRGNLTNRVGFLAMDSFSNDILKLATDYAAGEIAFSTGSSSEAVRIDSTGKVGIGIGTPTAKLHTDQASTTGAIPVLKLDQADIDDTFIDFVGTSAADGSRSISSDTTEDAAKFGAVRVEINGTTKWVRVYDDES